VFLDWNFCISSVFQRASVCCSVLQRVTVCCSALQCAAACCSVLQRVAVCCRVFEIPAQLWSGAVVICDGNVCLVSVLQCVAAW